MGFKAGKRPAAAEKKWGKPSYNDLESGLILGHKQRLNIKFPKESAFTMMRRRNAAPKRANAQRLKRGRNFQ
jgi:hypothetical protein